MASSPELRWLPLDNAAKIYPAARRQDWTNIFRLSATLTEPVDTVILKAALDTAVLRFPSIAARLRRGAFWYYLQQVSHAPDIQEENSYPLVRMGRKELRKCAFRVIVYKNRIAVEFFHSLTDGNGALIFLKSLVAEYLMLKHGIQIPAQQGVLNCHEPPRPEELEDTFQNHVGPVQAPREKDNAWRMKGTPAPDGFLHLTCMHLPVEQVKKKAKEYGVSVTVFLASAMMMAIQNLQSEHISSQKRRKHIKLHIPVDLRPMFPSQSLRNFVLYATPSIDPRLGHYDFGEICSAVRHQLGLAVNAKYMSSLIATNVSSERLLIVKLMPLFLKNLAMKIAFNIVGERKSCLSLSNLGVVQVPDAMVPFVQRFDFILGTQATAPHNCGILTYGDTLYINLIRNIQEPELEYHFFCVLRDLGLPVFVQSNSQEEN